MQCSVERKQEKKNIWKKKDVCYMSGTCYLLYAYLPVNIAIALQQNTSNKLVLILFLK